MKISLARKSYISLLHLSIYTRLYTLKNISLQSLE